MIFGLCVVSMMMMIDDDDNGGDDDDEHGGDDAEALGDEIADSAEIWAERSPNRGKASSDRNVYRSV